MQTLACLAADEPQSLKMSKLFTRVLRKEMADGTFRSRQQELRGRAFGRVLGGA